MVIVLRLLNSRLSIRDIRNTTKLNLNNPSPSAGLCPSNMDYLDLSIYIILLWYTAELLIFVRPVEIKIGLGRDNMSYAIDRDTIRGFCRRR